MIEELLLPDPTDATERAISFGLKGYSRMKFAEFLTDRVLGGRSEALDDRNKKLDIMIKKRQLGVPFDDDEYESQSNGRSNVSGMASAGVTSALSHKVLPAMRSGVNRRSVAQAGVDADQEIFRKEGVTVDPRWLRTPLGSFRIPGRDPLVDRLFAASKKKVPTGSYEEWSRIRHPGLEMHGGEDDSLLRGLINRFARNPRKDVANAIRSSGIGGTITTLISNIRRGPKP